MHQEVILRIVLHGLLCRLDLKSVTKRDSKVMRYSWIATCASQAMACCSLLSKARVKMQMAVRAELWSRLCILCRYIINIL